MSSQRSTIKKSRNCAEPIQRGNNPVQTKTFQGVGHGNSASAISNAPYFAGVGWVGWGFQLTSALLTSSAPLCFWLNECEEI